MTDPRLAQIAVLTSLALWGAVGLDFEIDPALSGLIVAVALGVQWAGQRIAGQRFDPRSALISGLSLVLLLRTETIWIGVLAAVLAVGSKFILRARGRHVFNPTNFALVVLLLATEAAWVSAGRWGSGPIAAAAFVGAASWVLGRARGDVTVAFMAFWSALLFGRALWLGDPLAIPMHQLQSGALLLFAGFMISDPRTIPDARAGRIVFAAAVALGGYVGRFVFYEPNALLFALVGCAPLVPLLDRGFPGERFEWRRQLSHPKDKEAPDAPIVPDPSPAHPARPGGRLGPVGAAVR